MERIMNKRLSKQQWQALLVEQEQSELSVAAFCREKKIKAKNFYNQRRNRSNEVATEAQPFVRAKLTTPQNLTEITLCYGHTKLCLPTDVSSTWLAKLMQA